jgi:hypothetical protein
MRRGFAGTLLIGFAIAACGSAPGPATDPPRPTAQPGSAALAGTRWNAVLLQGQALPAGVDPWLEIHAAGIAAGAGTCGPFGASASFERGTVGIVFDDPFVPCPGRDADARRSFLEILARAERYEVDGDAMIVAGSAGEIRFRRAAPPRDDPMRATFDRLRAGEWRLLRATVAVDVAVIPPLRFTDTGVVAAGDCGFGGLFALTAVDEIQFRSIDWSIDVCADPGGRSRVADVLRAATTVGFPDQRTLVIDGRIGQLVLGP